MKKIRISLIITLAVILITACSVVFTGSITGELHDRDAYEADEVASGIADATIYLYTEEEPWAEDLAAWAGGTGPLPDYPVDEDGSSIDPRYFLKTVTDEDGGFTFNGFIWEDLFPSYGKSGDRKEIFMLYYREDYDLTANDTPIYIVSDVTNRLPPTMLDRIYNTATIQGSVVDADDDELLGNVNVRIYVPTDWSYTSGGEITDVTWDEDPDYLITTDDTGRYEREILYPMKPNADDNRGTCFIRLTFARNGYVAEHSADTDLVDGGWDRDDDGIIEDDEDDAYYQSPIIEADTTEEMAEIALTGEYNTATITGTVEDIADGEGVANVNVDVYVPESWDYSGSDPTNIVWPDEPSYSLVTGTTGEYSVEIEFPREPELSDNEGTTIVRIIFSRNTYLITDDIDSDIIDGDDDENGTPDPTTGWDIDGSGTISSDERYYYQSDIITNGRSETMSTIEIRKTNFSGDLEGRVYEDSVTDLNALNGMTVKLFITETQPATPGSTEGDRTVTTSPRLVGDSTIQNGYFSIEDINWTDETHTGSQSSQECYIYIQEDGAWPVDPLNGDMYIYSGTTTWIDVVVDTE